MSDCKQAGFSDNGRLLNSLYTTIPISLVFNAYGKRKSHQNEMFVQVFDNCMFRTESVCFMQQL
jgi:hypothetical protein